MQDYSFFKRHVSGLVRWLWQIEVVGAENQPQEDGYLLCSNHTSMSDVIVLAVGTKRIIHYMAKAELLHIPIIGLSCLMISGINTISISSLSLHKAPQ